jgi:hypothetical protein
MKGVPNKPHISLLKAHLCCDKTDPFSWSWDTNPYILCLLLADLLWWLKPAPTSSNFHIPFLKLHERNYRVQAGNSIDQYSQNKNQIQIGSLCGAQSILVSSYVLVSPKKRTLVITSPVFSSLSAHSLISLSSQCSITDPDRIRASTVDGFIPLVAETRVTKFVWVVWYDRPLAWRMNLDVMICDDVKEKAKGPEVWNYCP